MNPDRKKVLEALLKIKKVGPRFQDDGICANIVLENGSSLTAIIDLVREWPHYSGNALFPIHTNKKLSPMWQFDTTYNHWDHNTNYGRRRWQLVNYLIRELRKEE